MKILAYIDNRKNIIKKTDLELVYYAHLIAQKHGGSVDVLVLGSSEGAGVFGKYGANNVFSLAHDTSFDANGISNALKKVAEDNGADLVIVPYNSSGKPLVGMLAALMNASSITGVLDVPEMDGGKLVFKKGVFSNKAFAYIKTLKDKVVVSLMTNSFSPQEVGDEVSVEPLSMSIDKRVKVVGIDKVEGKVPLPEAERIVSGGRGMKGPENWGVLLDLAKALDAETACSRPVADVGWRPHSEHVGQTGIVVRPNLYVALGISGAIQHLAGVSSSKVIVVINKDPEAPFFKAADYGVVGDLFEVAPKLTEAINKFKGA